MRYPYLSVLLSIAGLILLSSCSDALGYFTGVTSVSISSQNLVLRKGQSAQLNASVSPPSAQDTSAKWTTSDSSVAIVSGSGLVKGLKYGKATITCTTSDKGLQANCLVTVTDLFVSYSFDEAGGTSILDSSGNCNDAHLTSATRTIGKAGRAVSFPLSTSRVESIPVPSGMDTGNTIECWFSLSSIASNTVYCILGSYNYHELSLEVLNGKVNLNWDNTTYISSNTTIVAGTWYYLAISSDGNSIQLYIDGVLDASASISFPSSYTIGGYTIGSRYVYGGGNPMTYYKDNFGGTIDEFRWWKISLPASEILSTYNLTK